MTRKQAVFQAIKELENINKNDNFNEIISVLKDIHEELPSPHWNQKNTLDAFQEYLNNNHNKFPPIHKLGKNKLPTNKVIRRLFNMTYREFKKEYFPDSNGIKDYENNNSRYKHYSKIDFLNIFISNYYSIKSRNKCKYVTVKSYDLYRDKNTPVANTILRNLECKTYKELLIYAGIKTKHKNFNVTSNKRTVTDFEIK